MDESASPPPPSPDSPAPGSVKSVASEIARTLQLRIELAKLEAVDAVVHFIKLAALGLGGVLLATAAYLFAATALIGLIAKKTEFSWESVTLAVALVHLLIGAGLFFSLKQRVKNPIFMSTVDQLKKDQQWLGKGNEGK